MSQTIEAVYDGSVLRPDRPLELKPNTRVRITIVSTDVPPPLSRAELEADYAELAAYEASIGGAQEWNQPMVEEVADAPR